MRIFLL